MSDGLKMKYFVLKPAGDSAHAIASRDALKAYAKSIEEEEPKLAHDLLIWGINEQGKSNQRDLERRLGEQK